MRNRSTEPYTPVMPTIRNDFANAANYVEFAPKGVHMILSMTLHSDLGNNENPTRYEPLMAHILKTYPDNIIVWAHMGLSKELTDMKAADHIALMSKHLDKSPNLILDVSWRVLQDYYFNKPEDLKIN